MSWLTRLFGSKQSPPAGTDEGTGFLCKGTSPDELEAILGSLASELRGLPIVRADLLGEFWDRGPVDEITGADAAANAVVAKIQEEARLIGQHVADIQALDVTARREATFDGVMHNGPEDHICLKLARRFRNGGVDLILHHVLRVSEETYQFAYMRL